jgi:hypothetical protein
MALPAIASSYRFALAEGRQILELARRKKR